MTSCSTRARVELDQRDLDARLVALVDLVRGVERHQPAGLDLGGRVGDPVLDRLLVGERARRTPRARARGVHMQLERALHLAEPAHARGGSGPARAASARSGSRRPARRACSRPARARPCSGPRSASSSPGRACPKTGDRRTISTPGVSAGTMICVARRCGSASGSVTAITIPNAAPSAPDENHLWPSITHSSPSRTARVRSAVGSEPETSGSVIEKNERISPATSGAQPALLLLVACRTGAGSRRCPRRAPGSRRRAAPSALRPISSFR